MTAGTRDARAGPRRPVRGWLESHLGSRDVARVLYGSVVGLALVVALEAHPPAAAQAAGVVTGAALAVALAECFAELIGEEARTRRPISRAGVRGAIEHAAFVALGAAAPAAFLVLAALEVLHVGTAFTLAKWTGLALILAYGYGAARLSGSSVPRAVVHAAGAGIIGGAVIALKALVH